MKLSDLQKLVSLLRMDVLDMTHKAGSGHVGGSLSALDIMASLYFGEINEEPVLCYNSANPGFEGQDYFVLSKGHAAPALYAILAEAGFFDRSELDYFRQPGALLTPSPTMRIPGVCVPTGLLGSGLSVANGIALGLKMDKAKNRVYCLLGDGELQEGQVWEAALTTAHHQLTNVTLIIDWNKLAVDGEVKATKNVEPIQDKFEAFGWKVINILDGHNIFQILKAIENAWRMPRSPVVIIAPTIKGKGVPFMENRVHYHAAALSDEEMREATVCLERSL